MRQKIRLVFCLSKYQVTHRTCTYKYNIVARLLRIHGIIINGVCDDRCRRESTLTQICIRFLKEPDIFFLVLYQYVLCIYYIVGDVIIMTP